jgi:uncharacterized protein
MDRAGTDALGRPKLLLFLAIQSILFAAAGLGLWLWSGRPAADFLQFRWFDLFAGLALSVLLVAPLAALFAFRPRLRERMAREMGRTLFATERPFGPGAILLISLSAGIGEEALFRGGIQTLAGDHLPPWAAVALTAALFTAAHPGSRTFMAFVAAIAIVLGAGYHLTGSLLAVMIAHAALDIWGCVQTQAELRRIGHWQDQAGDG